MLRPRPRPASHSPTAQLCASVSALQLPGELSRVPEFSGTCHLSPATPQLYDATAFSGLEAKFFRSRAMCDFWQDALPRSRRPSDQHLTKTTFFDGMSPQLVIQGEFGCEGRISSVHRPSPPPPCVSVARFLPPRPSRLCVSMARERVSCSTFPPPAPLPLNENTSQGVPSQMRVKSLAAGIINGVAAALSGVSWRDPRGGQPLVGFRGAIVCAGADPPPTGAMASAGDSRLWQARQVAQQPRDRRHRRRRRRRDPPHRGAPSLARAPWDPTPGP